MGVPEAGGFLSRAPPPFTHLAVTKTERRMDSRAFGNIRRQLSLWSRRWVGTRVPLGPNGGVLLGIFQAFPEHFVLTFDHQSTQLTQRTLVVVVRKVRT